MRRWYQTEPRHWLLGGSFSDFYRWLAIMRPWLRKFLTFCGKVGE